jgi:hypothetical protein
LEDNSDEDIVLITINWLCSSTMHICHLCARCLGKGNSRKDPVQLTDPMMLLLATTIFDQYGKKSEVLAVTTRQIR